VPLPKFDYYSPRTLAEACSFLSQHKGKARVIAGGTDLLVKMGDRKLAPQYLVGLKGISDLDYIKHDAPEGLRIGALATNQAIANSPVIRERFGCLAEAAGEMGTVQVRNLGTIGGNLCNAAPSADVAPPLIALGARLKLVSPRGERIIEAEEFFAGPGETVLMADEILAEVQVPKQPAETQAVYLRLSQRSQVDIAAVGVAVSVTVGREGVCNEARIALGAVAPTPIRARKAEEAIKGKRIDDDLINRAAQLAAEESRPISDIRSSADYRREMVKVLTKRAMKQAVERVKSGRR